MLSRGPSPAPGAAGADARPDAFTVLFVCTGNICRSAFAERLGRARLQDIPGLDPAAVRLGSAGTRAVVGAGMDPDTARVLLDYGGSPAGFSSRQLNEDLVGAADLVLTLTRDHRRQALALGPRGLARTFTLREAGDLATLLQPTPQFAGASLEQRARAMVRAMAEARGRRSGGPADDVPDPFGQPLALHRHAAELIDEALRSLLARFALAASPGGPPVSAQA